MNLTISDFLDERPELPWPKSTPIKDYYVGKNVFLSGVTGCVGRLMMQKLIRLDVNKIYIHIRSKKGASAKERFQDLCEDVTMKRAIKHNPQFMDQIVIVEGDLDYPNLGMSSRDVEDITQNVQIIMAVAADVRFNQPIRNAVNANIRSIRDLLRIAEKMPQLESFIFMSTAYSNNFSSIGEEKLYNLPVEPETLLEFANLENGGIDMDVQIVTQKIIQPWFNTYTFTKNIAEYLVMRYKKTLPVAIIRPSIIIATDSDPVAGWIGNLYGFNGILVGYMYGVLRLCFACNTFVADIIPGDYVSNSTLSLAYYTYMDFQKKLNIPEEDPIYNCASSIDNPITWGKLNEYQENCNELPTMKSIWYPKLSLIANWTLFKFYNIIYHLLPAFFVDKIFVWRGDTFRLIRIYRTIFHNINAFSYFIREWRFDTRKMRSIYDRMSEDDHKIFPCDIRKMSWAEFNPRFYLGVRTMWLKDPLSTLPEAITRMQKIKIAYFILNTIFLSLIYYMLYVVIRMTGAIDYLKKL